MNHLSSYKLFEAYLTDEEIISYLRDISLELVDEGFEVDISATDNWGPIRRFLVVIKKESGFNIKDTKDTIEQMTNYMEQEKFYRGEINISRYNPSTHGGIVREIKFKFH